MRLLLPLAAFALVVLAAYAPRPELTPAHTVRADSSEWENLQVLPDSLTRDQLIGIMRGFTDALGVQCGYCHVREDGEFVFASDEKEHKEVARGMMRMTWQINQEILPAIDGLGLEGGEMHVTCYTCHRGATHPAHAIESGEEEPHEHEEGDPEHSHGDHNRP